MLGQMEKVGGVGVQLMEGLPDGLPEGKGTKELTDTVASPRLDAVVASVCRVSREEAARRIAAGLGRGQPSAGYRGQRGGEGRGHPVGPGKRPISNHPGGAAHQKGPASSEGGAVFVRVFPAQRRILIRRQGRKTPCLPLHRFGITPSGVPPSAATSRTMWMCSGKRFWKPARSCLRTTELIQKLQVLGGQDRGVPQRER